MPFTLGTVVDDATYRISLTLRDQYDEEIRKVSRLYNPAAPLEGVEDAMQAFEALTDAGLVSASATIQSAVTGASTLIGTSGVHSLVAHALVLGFDRPHPLNANKIVTTTFVIPAPVATIIAGVGFTITPGGDFASAAGPQDALNALVAWLQNNLVYEDITGAITVGGWTYRPGRSSLITDARILEGVANT